MDVKQCDVEKEPSKFADMTSTTVNTDDNSPVEIQIIACSESNLESELKLNEIKNSKTVSKILKDGSEFMELQAAKHEKIQLYAEDTGPSIYSIKNNLVTRPLIPKNLPKAFRSMPIYGAPNSEVGLKEFYLKKIREFVGLDLNDEEFSKLESYCSPDNLKTGNELVLPMTVPGPGIPSLEIDCRNDDGPELCVTKKFKMRMKRDIKGFYPKKLKYRGVRFVSSTTAVQEGNSQEDASAIQLEPGKDLVYRVRVYRPFIYNPKERQFRSRHSLLRYDVVLYGRQKLTALRDRIVCANDVGMRVDVSDCPDVPPVTTAKDIFPSNMLCINNVMYVDGPVDYSAPIRQWAKKYGIGALTSRNMNSVRLDELNIRLGYPEVYMHQGNCEHLFTFSEIRLLNASDALSSSCYPYHTMVGQHQSVYCTTCAEFGAKWIVVGCQQVPFDPAFFCDTCLKHYLYKDGVKIGNFKAYSYRGNEINVGKPQL